MKMQNQSYFFVVVCTGLLLVSTTILNAATPAEMAELSLQELLAMSTDEESNDTGPWSMSVLYSRRKLDGYQAGTDKLSNGEVQFVPGETRTDKNFPVLPTVITQEAVIITTRYAISDANELTFSIPHIKQSTDHESIVPGYSFFNITSSGLGDISFGYSGALERWDSAFVSYTIGLSLPTGSIDEQGDTPRATGDQQLPYTMQLGSGTWDIPLGLHYQNEKSSWTWGANIFAKVRTGRPKNIFDKAWSGTNDRNYRLGDRFSISAWGRFFNSAAVRPTAKISYQYADKIHGRDEELIVPGPFPYPASITDPGNFGGEKVDITLGSEIGDTEHSFVVQIGMPIYQDLNGVQPKETVQINISWNDSF